MVNLNLRYWIDNIKNTPRTQEERNTVIERISYLANVILELVKYYNNTFFDIDYDELMKEEQDCNVALSTIKKEMYETYLCVEQLRCCILKEFVVPLVVLFNKENDIHFEITEGLTNPTVLDLPPNIRRIHTLYRVVNKINKFLTELEGFCEEV